MRNVHSLWRWKVLLCFQVSITTTSPLRLSPSTLGTSSLLRHATPKIMLKLSWFQRSFSNFLLTVLVSHVPPLLHTMNSPVLALTPKYTPSYHMHVNFPSEPPARLLFHEIPYANIMPALSLSCSSSAQMLFFLLTGSIHGQRDTQVRVFPK